MLIVRSVLGEVGRNFLMALAATTGIVFFLLSIRFMQRTPGVGMGFLVEIFPLFFPMALQYTVPLAVLTGVVLTFSRLALDGELVALHASGVPLHTLARPVLAAAAVVALGAFLMTDLAAPFAAERLRAARRNVPQQLKTSFRAGLCDLDLEKGRISFESFRGGTFTDVCVEWRRTPEELELWRAERGSIAITEDERVVIELRNVQRVLPWGTEKGEIFLAAGDVVVDRSLSDLMAERQTARPRRALKSWELAYVSARDFEERRGARMDSTLATGELARRSALAASAFFFAVIGIPLGILGAWAGRVGAFLVAFAPVLLTYFPLVMLGVNLARDGTVPAYPALWTANLVLLAVGVWLLRRLAKR
ncbi:MAG: LptF/LptG family permease [Planctomycetota bacterium]|jgi:lipopolysaccharide export system permease protein